MNKTTNKYADEISDAVKALERANEQIEIDGRDATSGQKAARAGKGWGKRGFQNRNRGFD